MNEINYVSFDSLQEGVGASQALAYMQKIVKVRPVTILSFEKEMPDKFMLERVQQEGINWIPLPFGRFGILGGINRILRMSRVIDRSKIIHARSTSAGIAALLCFPPMWIWDCRSLQADQRRAISAAGRISMSYILLRTAEYLLAKKSKKIIVITRAVIPILTSRYKIDQGKMTCIPTCVDTIKFPESFIDNTSDIRILLSGTFSPAYDLELTNKIILELKKYRNVSVSIAAASGDTGLWTTIPHEFEFRLKHHEMPEVIQKHHIGMSIWKNDLGVCLTSVASTKTAEFLSCGRPVFVNSLQGDFGTLIGENRIGVVTNDSSEHSISSYVMQILELMDDPFLSQRCHRIAEEKFSLEQGVLILKDLYCAVEAMNHK
jgi:glycosyltransferase involved in cell wall biosynthesis